jgi:hypothetical protein
MVHGIAARVVTLLLLAVALTGVIQATKLFSQELLFTRAQTELSFWGRGSYRPEPASILGTEQALHKLLSGAAANPEYLALQANYAAWQGYWAEDFQVAQQFGREAVDTQFAALQSRPAHRHGWAKMVEYASRIQNGKPMRTLAQARVKALASALDPI